jgi:hypothetical protein
MTCPENNDAAAASKEPPAKDASMLVLMALIRALHESGVLPAQATADVLDRRAVNAALRTRTGDEETVRMTAVLIQQIADQIERDCPFESTDRGQPRS